MMLTMRPLDDEIAFLVIGFEEQLGIDWSDQLLEDTVALGVVARALEGSGHDSKR